MEYQNSNQSLFDLNFNENLKTQLKGTAVWAGIAAIISLAGSILSLAGIFLIKKDPSANYRVEGFENATVTAESSTGALIAGGVISFTITLLLFYFLNRFSSLTKNGLNGNNQDMVSNGLGGLASYFITIGVIVIIFLAIFLVVIAGVAAGGLGK